MAGAVLLAQEECRAGPFGQSSFSGNFGHIPDFKGPRQLVRFYGNPHLRLSVKAQSRIWAFV
jgi:hypothetical protein